MNETLRIRPYARLLTMLGDQLIKNEQIAVTELMKNSYDADADWVKVSFEGYGENCKILPDSRIVIEDNGCGMTHDVITNAWMNPATPNKHTNVVSDQRTRGGRVIQGEKGIGRFAMLKLGRTIEMVTRPEGDEKEFSITFDFARFDDDFLTEEGEAKEIFLEQLDFNLKTKEPGVFVSREVAIGNKVFDGEQNAKGTRIVITNLRGTWSERKIKSLTDSFERFGNLFGIIGDDNQNSKEKSFTIGLFHNGTFLLEENRTETLNSLIEQKAVFSVKGHYDNDNQEFSFTLNEIPCVLRLDDAKVRGLQVFKKQFYNEECREYRAVSDFGPFKGSSAIVRGRFVD